MSSIVSHSRIAADAPLLENIKKYLDLANETPSTAKQCENISVNTHIQCSVAYKCSNHLYIHWQ